METIKFKVTCKELNGGITTSTVELNENDEFSFDTTKVGPKINANDIDSGDAASGNVLTANGIGGAEWESVGAAIQNLVQLNSTSGTLTSAQLDQAKENDCFIKLTLNGVETFYRKYRETSTMIYFTLVSEGDVSAGSAQINRNHIDITISSGAYVLSEGEIIDTYNKEQIDNAFTEVDL